MEKIALLLLFATLLTAEVLAYKQKDLDRLRDTHNCVKCDLRGAILREANLSGANMSGARLWEAILQEANLEGAVLRAADLDYARMKDAIFCNTVTPDGQRIFKDC